MGNLAPLMSSAREDWETPDSLLELVGPIELDVATKAWNPTRANRGYVAPVWGNWTWPDQSFPGGMEYDAFAHSWDVPLTG